VVPRQQCFGEAVDDHQVELARRLALSNLVTLVEDPQALGSALAAPAEQVESPFRRETALSQDIRSYLASCCASVEAR
jgi:UDP-N-acetylglucosamine transferase subunit ALG13